MGKMSRDKGKVGEREVAALVRSFGFDAKRGVQYSGGVDSPDIQHSIPGIHIEVKRVEKLNLRDAMKQARGDAKGKAAVVFHRTNQAPWLVTMDATDFLLMQRTNLSAVRVMERLANPALIFKDDGLVHYRVGTPDEHKPTPGPSDVEFGVGKNNVGNGTGRAGQGEQGGETSERGTGFGATGLDPAR